MSENNVFLGQSAAEMIACGTKEQIDKYRINYQLTDDNAGILISGGFEGNAQNDSLMNGIDVNNLITTIPAAAEQTYTATEECFILTHCVAGSDKSVVIYLDDVLIASIYSNPSIISITKTIFVAKGQTVKVVRNLSNFDREIYVYGIKYKEDKLKCYTYDTKEHVVGTWFDGKPLYEKSIVDLGSKFGGLGSCAYTIDWSSYGVTDTDIFFGYIPKCYLCTDITADGYPSGELIAANVYGEGATYQFQLSNVTPTGGWWYRGSGWSKNFPYVVITVRYTKN